MTNSAIQAIPRLMAEQNVQYFAFLLVRLAARWSNLQPHLAQVIGLIIGLSIL
jgi:hypothetical protein